MENKKSNKYNKTVKVQKWFLKYGFIEAAIAHSAGPQLFEMSAGSQEMVAKRNRH